MYQTARHCRSLRNTAIFLFALVTTACGDSPTGPTPPPSNNNPPQVTFYTVTGTVSSAAGGPIAGASVRVVDGPNAGRTASADGSGRYTLENLNFAGFTIAVAADGFVETSRGITLTAGVTTATTNFTLLPAALWSQAGAGNTVFSMPSYFNRVRIRGTWNRISNSNFIVSIGGRLVVNEILRQSITYDGVHLTNGGGQVVIESSSGISWSFTEER
jgi:hypothetical protein